MQLEGSSRKEQEKKISQVPIIAFPVCLSHEKSNLHFIYPFTLQQPMNEHHSFQPPDLENVIFSTIS